MDFLLGYLSENGEQKKSDILRAAREQGIRERTIDRAKAKLDDRVKAVRQGFAGHSAAWYWTLTSEEVPE